MKVIKGVMPGMLGASAIGVVITACECGREKCCQDSGN